MFKAAAAALVLPNAGKIIRKKQPHLKHNAVHLAPHLLLHHPLAFQPPRRLINADLLGRAAGGAAVVLALIAIAYTKAAFHVIVIALPQCEIVVDVRLHIDRLDHALLVGGFQTQDF